MTVERRRFLSIQAPDWGHDHLGTDAVVAFVDDELAHGPHHRAVEHLAGCLECAAEVLAQRRARTALRAASCPALPSSLMSSLRAIPRDTELPPPPPGLAVSDDGELGSILRPERDPVRARAPGRRMRFGAGAAMSGLAMGAIALGVSAVPGDARQVPPVERGALGGPVLGGGVLDARIGVSSARPGAVGRADDQRAEDLRVIGSIGPSPMLYLHRGPR